MSKAQGTRSCLVTPVLSTSCFGHTGAVRTREERKKFTSTDTGKDNGKSKTASNEQELMVTIVLGNV